MRPTPRWVVTRAAPTPMGRTGLACGPATIRSAVSAPTPTRSGAMASTSATPWCTRASTPSSPTWALAKAPAGSTRVATHGCRDRSTPSAMACMAQPDSSTEDPSSLPTCPSNATRDGCRMDPMEDRGRRASTCIMVRASRCAHGAATWEACSMPMPSPWWWPMCVATASFHGSGAIVRIMCSRLWATPSARSLCDRS